MTWQLFTKGPQSSRIFWLDFKGKPSFITPLYVASFSTATGEEFAKRARATLQTLKSASKHTPNTQFLLSAYDLTRRLEFGRKSEKGEDARKLVGTLQDEWYWHLDSGVYEKTFFDDDNWNAVEFLSVFRAVKPPSVVAFDHGPQLPEAGEFRVALEKSADLVNATLSGSSITLLVRFHDGGGLWEKEKTLEERVRIERLLAHIAEVLLRVGKSVDVVGVCEVELGPGIRSRLRSLARLRLALERAEMATPIHVFGASDPQTIAFYSLAGGDIFDGTHWSRYYLDIEDLCFRDKSLLSWKEPVLGESAFIPEQREIVAVNNILGMQNFMARLRRLIEARRPQTSQEENWLKFVESCCGDIV